MFFKPNNEKTLGYKELSQADLGLGESHQTHIGLFKGVLENLPNTDYLTTAMLIYENHCDILDCYFDRIKTPHNNFRSPKIRSGNGKDSVVKRIRHYAKEKPYAKWYLVWIGLEGGEIVFLLFNEDSDDYVFINSFLGLKNTTKATDLNFLPILSYLEDKINAATDTLQKQFELDFQIGTLADKENTAFNIEEIQKKCKNVGYKGEELIQQYLEREKKNKNVISYTWENASRESGLPYDFKIKYNTNSPICYVDVKSTSFSFDRPVVFSDSEIDFISRKQRKAYQLYRVFDLSKEINHLTICNYQIKDFAEKIIGHHNSYRQTLNGINKTDIKTCKFLAHPEYFIDKESSTIIDLSTLCNS